MQFSSVLRTPDAVSVRSGDQLHVAAPAGAERWTFPGGEISIRRGGGTLAVALTATGAPVGAVILRWRQPIEPGVSLLGDHWERAYGDLEWRGVVPERVMPWLFIASDGTDSYGCGVKTDAAALCSWRADPEGLRLTLDVRCGGADVELGQRVLDVATLVEHRNASGETPFQAARGLAAKLCDAPLLPAQPVYGANDFYYAYCENTQGGLLRDAQIISELSPRSDNRPYSVVDAGWQWTGEAYGSPWIPNRHFPDMARLAADMREAGTRPGIWFRPLLSTERTPAHWRLDQNRFRITREFGWMLDPSLPDVLEHIAAEVRKFTGWGYELIKHDYTTFDLFGRWGKDMGDAITDRGWCFSDRSRTTAEIVRSLYQTIHTAAGDAIVIGCNTIGHLAAGQVHLQRVGDDTSGKVWNRTRQMGVNALGFRAWQHDALFAVDADCVGITTDIPWALNRQWLDLLARSGTPLFVSIDPASLGAQQRSDLRQALDHASAPQPLGEPLDWMLRTCPSRWRFGDTTASYDWFMD